MQDSSPLTLRLLPWLSCRIGKLFRCLAISATVQHSRERVSQVMAMLSTSTRNGLVALSRHQRPLARLHQSCASSRIAALPASSPALLRSQASLRCRNYADAAGAGNGQQSQIPTPPQPPKTKKKKAGFFRWTYRVVLLSLAAGSGALGYGIYNARHPEDQIDPDPSKKTLVVLGECRPFFFLSLSSRSEG